MTKRNDIEIKAEILTEAKEGARISRLVYHCNLNFKIIAPYLSELIAAGLLSVKWSLPDGRTYTTTENGLEALDIYAKLRGIFEAPKNGIALWEVRT